MPCKNEGLNTYLIKMIIWAFTYGNKVLLFLYNNLFYREIDHLIPKDGHIITITK